MILKINDLIDILLLNVLKYKFTKMEYGTQIFKKSTNNIESILFDNINVINNNANKVENKIGEKLYQILNIYMNILN